MSTSTDSPPRATRVRFEENRLAVDLSDGRTIAVPLRWFPRLHRASAAARAAWRLVGIGIGIHWEALDEDLSVRGLLERSAPPRRHPRGPTPARRR